MCACMLWTRNSCKRTSVERTLRLIMGVYVRLSASVQVALHIVQTYEYNCMQIAL